MRLAITTAYLAASALLLAAIACGGGDGAAPVVQSPSASAQPPGLALEGTVYSDDGLARVDVPVGALPAGVRLADIRITKQDPAGLPFKPANGPSLGAYKLEPEGTKFNVPVIFAVTVPQGDGPYPALVMVSEGQVSAVLGLELTHDASSGTVTVTSDLNHFSQSVLVEGFLRIQIDSPDKAIVGEQFALTVTVSLESNAVNVPVEGNLLDMVGLGEPVALAKLQSEPILYGKLVVKSGPLSPSEYFNVPVVSTRDSGQWTQRPEFSCREFGTGVVEYQATLNIEIEVTKVGLFGQTYVFDRYQGPAYHVARSTEIKCVFPSAPPTKPPVVQANRPPNISPIEASVAGRSTTYSIVIDDPDNNSITVTWSGPNCGNWEPKTVQLRGRGTAEMKWDHPTPPCEHPDPTHRDATIVAEVSDGASVVRCTYVGAASSEGVLPTKCEVKK
jgi:hypothetical protein